MRDINNSEFKKQVSIWLGTTSYDEFEKIIYSMENQLNCRILFFTIIGSYMHNLSNKSSDYDVHLVFESSQERVKFDYIHCLYLSNGHNIDIHGRNIEYLLNTVKQYDRDMYLHPLYIHKTQENRDSAHAQSVLDAEDFDRSFIFQILQSSWIWNYQEYICCNRDSLDSAMKKLDILNYLFSRAQGNFDFQFQKDNVLGRKYLYALHKVYTMKHILKTNEIPSSDFIVLFEQYGEGIDDVIKLFNLNRCAADSDKNNTKEYFTIPRNEIVNEYLKTELKNIAEKITKLAMKDSEHVVNY